MPVRIGLQLGIHCDDRCAVINDDLLSQRPRNSLRKQPRHEVAAATGLGRNDAYRTSRVALRLRISTQHQQDGGHYRGKQT